MLALVVLAVAVAASRQGADPGDVPGRLDASAGARPRSGFAAVEKPSIGSTCAEPCGWSAACPVWLALIFFSCFNNLLGGAFMALWTPTACPWSSVQAWGLLWGVLSTGVIFGGLLVARAGLGSNPVRTLLMATS